MKVNRRNSRQTRIAGAEREGMRLVAKLMMNQPHLIHLFTTATRVVPPLRHIIALFSISLAFSVYVMMMKNSDDEVFDDLSFPVDTPTPVIMFFKNIRGLVF
jgi:hypothetical protein